MSMVCKALVYAPLKQCQWKCKNVNLKEKFNDMCKILNNRIMKMCKYIYQSMFIHNYLQQ